MADLIRSMGALGPPVKDKLGSPSTESEDGGGDVAELAADLELDEPDGPSTINGKSYKRTILHPAARFFVSSPRIHIGLFIYSCKKFDTYLSV